MKAVLTFLSTLLFLFSAYIHGYTFIAQVLDHEVNQGDAFLLRVTDVEVREMPEAVFLGKQLHFSRCGEGCFVAVGAVEIDTEPGGYSITLRVGEEKKNLDVAVKPASFPEISLTLPESKVTLSPENLERAQRENAKLKEIWQTVSDKLWNNRFITPLENPISTEFGTKRIINQKKVSVHKGMDIKGKEGEKVKASNSGRVVLSEELFFGGNTVIIDHGHGIYTIYMHLSESGVRANDFVSQGDIVGLVGSSGRVTGPHLHFGVKVLNININPVSLLKLQL